MRTPGQSGPGGLKPHFGSHCFSECKYLPLIPQWLCHKSEPVSLPSKVRCVGCGDEDLQSQLLADWGS